MANLFTNPENLNSGWGPSAALIDSNVITAPDGTLTGDRLKDNNAGGTGQSYIGQSVTVATSTQHVMSVFCQEDQLSFLAQIIVSFTTPAGVPVAWYDVDNGAVGTVTGGWDETGIVNYGGGWHRCWSSFTTDPVDTTGTCRFYLDDADNGGRTVDLDDTSSIYLWGLVLEEGSFPSTYVSVAGHTVLPAGGTLGGDGDGIIWWLQ